MMANISMDYHVHDCISDLQCAQRMSFAVIAAREKVHVVAYYVFMSCILSLLGSDFCLLI